MEKIRFDVVGLYHWDVRDNWKEYAAGAVGKQLVLQPQPENVKDPYAVRAREGRLHIGYVAVTDLDVVYQALKGSGLNRLHGVMPRKMEQLGDLTADLTDALVSEETSAYLRPLITELLTSNLYDMSREMTRMRYRIERLLAQRCEPEWQEVADHLRQQKGMLMTHDNRAQVARYLFIDIPLELLSKGLQESHYTYDNRLDELKSQLSAFPYQLYDKFLSDPVDFLREVYYKHVPRKYLNQLLSGIILMILKGRVEIGRWGREGKRDAIEQRHSMSKTAILPKTGHKIFSENGIKNLAQEKWAYQEKENSPSRFDVIDSIFRK